MKKLLYVPILGLLFAIAAVPQGSTAVGVPIDDDAARSIVGGQAPCGNTWIAGTVSCNGGVNLCGGVATNCSTKTFSSLVTNGVGNLKPQCNSSPPGCTVCAISCGTAPVVIQTTPCGN